MKLFASIALLLASNASAFAPLAKPPSAPRTASSVVAAAGSSGSSKGPAEVLGAAVLSLLLAGAPLVPLVAGPEPAMAARSGGRAGGSRSFSSGRPAAAAPRPAARAAGGGSTTVIRNNYGGGGYGGGGVMIMPPISPFGYGYSPLNGIGTGYALGAMSSGGNRAETYRLENQVDRERGEVNQVEQDLAVQKEKNAELERRLAALEAK